MESTETPRFWQERARVYMSGLGFYEVKLALMVLSR